ncbi:alpha-amylase family glycosyl hydrolase [Haloferula sargassicola]|uniref:Alpha-1,4-glucan:maltose-1-phosphate maltosyltransferase n=1 Tax=Haloferula sargassicola TaxID=490096 RepID=A0ABP9UQT1_9BACT
MDSTSRSTQVRPVIYQALPRLFGNTNETRKPNGTLAENGCGRFSDFNDRSLAEIRKFGATHLWLTGVPEQASATAYPGRPADPPDILKGKAGSPYAITDYFDVCPDYAEDPQRRVEEFRELLERCHKHGLRVVIDFVPNHVARSYASSGRPELSFGAGDDPSVFFHRDNNFFYVQPGMAEGGPPLRLPTAEMPGCSGRFEPEDEHVRVTGNNAITFHPSVYDWYETVKLNYGHDFTTGRDTSHLPGPDAEPAEVPDTWRKMDEAFAWWQELGVGGFRVDMAHIVPMEFWRWMLRRARERDPDLYVFGEAYDNDPTKLTDGNVLDALIEAGFDAVYDDPAYDLAMGLYDDFEGYKWANDLDSLIFPGTRFHHSLRYAENHDEVRLASPKEWGGLGMEVGKPVCATLLGMGRGPVMIYHGQEVGEPAIGAEGFCGDNARTSIFDYGAMPEFQKWVNGGKFDGGGLSTEQKALRGWYAKLLSVIHEPAFTRGDFHGLNHANKDNDQFGRMEGETCSGHWLYAYFRRDPVARQVFLVVANFHPTETMKNPLVHFPAEALQWAGIPAGRTRWIERLARAWEGTSESHGDLRLPALKPLSARMLEWVG